MSRHFSSATFAFLRDLAANNQREWFHANKERYEASVQEPALDFITDVGKRLEKVSPHFTADAKVVGGSLFRIQRDIRFSKDKTPYKTNTGVQFRHESAGDAHAPGYYLHLEPSGSFFGVGLWRPETAVARTIREAIADDPATWKKATRSKAFTASFELEGDSLVRPPKGFDPDHALIDDLKRKDFVATARLTQRQIIDEEFDAEFVRLCRTATPFMRFLCQALGLPF